MSNSQVADEKVIDIFNESIKAIEKLISLDLNEATNSIMQIELATLIEALKKKSRTELKTSHFDDKFYEGQVELPQRSISPYFNTLVSKANHETFDELDFGQQATSSSSNTTSTSSSNPINPNNGLTFEEEIAIDNELAWAINQSKKETTSLTPQQKIEKQIQEFHRSNPNVKHLPLQEYNELLQGWLAMNL